MYRFKAVYLFMEVDVLLKEPLSQWFGAAFCRQSGRMGLATLEDILVLEPEELLLRPGFSMAWLGELTVFLQERGLLHLLQTIPGRSGGRSF